MFKQAVIHYPTDVNAVKLLNREIASFHCDVAVKYMDALKLNIKQKITLTDSLMQDLSIAQQQGCMVEQFTKQPTRPSA